MRTLTLCGGIFALILISCGQSDNGTSSPLAAAVASAPSCKSYSFTKIADSSDAQFSSLPLPAVFNSLPSIDSQGSVAFFETRNDLLLAGDGKKLKVLYQAGDGFFTGFGGHPSINSAGTVAFLANTVLGGGVFSGKGSEPTSITGIGFPNTGFGNVKINEAGVVAFRASSAGIFVGSGGNATPIVDSNGPLKINSLDDPSINNAGLVVFHGEFLTGGFGIFTGNGSTLTPVADSTGPLDFDGNFGRSPSINNQGTVAFLAKLDAGEMGVFKAINGAIVPIVDSTGPFSVFEDQGPSINNRGTVAFRGFLDDGGEGIFVGPDPSKDKVIAIGDTLFGKRVRFIGFGNAAFNDRCQVAFFATTDNNTFGIYRADPN